ncbi:CPBP family intramembrane glutamic endopeptidase [Nocardia miyunensis]|uniref:CPBP family intramembrane glutamic endopeptidase n=1 Tax=Nocardia miyunensis TaxID=282684 RepID=UPI001FE02F98|nr:CPBP family intramembrane glutamic endopeptidase [Nocardia miyunensis]
MSLPLLWHNWLLPRLRLGPRGRTAANAVFATACAAAFGIRETDYDLHAAPHHAGGYRDSVPTRPIGEARLGSLGVGPCGLPDRRVSRGAGCSARVGNEVVARHRAGRVAHRGLCWGGASLVAVAVGYGTALAIPPVRTRLAEFATRATEVDLAEWVVVHIPIGTVYSEELIFRGVLDPLLDEEFGPLGIWLGATAFGLWHIGPARAAGDSVLATIAATASAGLILGLLRRRTGSAIAPALLHLAVNAGGAIAPRIALRAIRTGRAGTDTLDVRRDPCG